MRTILVVAAEAREFHGLLFRQRVRTLQWGLQFSCETDLNGHRAILVADGPGMQLAGAATDVARRHLRPDVVVSTGFCGAIDPALNTGDVFVARSVIDKEHAKTYASTDPDTAAAYRRGDLVSVNRVANTPVEKQELGSTGASVIDMEAAAVASRAQVWEVPFFCIKSVSDSAAQSFEIDFNRMRDRHGRFSRGRIVLSALGRPWSRIPGLFRLNRSCRLASKSLGEFLADCRF